MVETWYLTVVFNGRVNLTSLAICTDEDQNYREYNVAVDRAVHVLNQEFTPIDVHVYPIKDAIGNEVNGFTLVNNVLTASLIKA